MDNKETAPSAPTKRLDGRDSTQPFEKITKLSASSVIPTPLAITPTQRL